MAIDPMSVSSTARCTRPSWMRPPRGCRRRRRIPPWPTKLSGPARSSTESPALLPLVASTLASSGSACIVTAAVEALWPPPSSSPSRRAGRTWAALPRPQGRPVAAADPASALGLLPVAGHLGALLLQAAALAFQRALDALVDRAFPRAQALVLGLLVCRPARSAARCATASPGPPAWRRYRAACRQRCPGAFISSGVSVLARAPAGAGWPPGANSLMPTNTSSSAIGISSRGATDCLHRALTRSSQPRRPAAGSRWRRSGSRRQQRLGQAIGRAVTNRAPWCPDGVPAAQFGCWKVAATKFPCRAHEVESSQRAAVLVSRTAVTHWSSRRHAAKCPLAMHRQRQQQRCPARGRSAGLRAR